MVFRVDVWNAAGTVCELEVLHLHWRGDDLKRIISDKSGYCSCRIDLHAGSQLQYPVRLHTPVTIIMQWMRPQDHERVLAQWLQEDHDGSLFMKIKSVEDRTMRDLLYDGICIRCMYEGGVPLINILANWISTGCNAESLIAAGVPLNVLLEARNQIPVGVQHKLCGHPPCMPYTLFHSQLQAAGYTASDFRSAGFTARDLSYKASDFFREDDLTVGDLEWEETHAFFSLEDLKQAGFEAKDLVEAGFTDARELLHAGFGLSDLIEAGLTECKLPQAKRRPRKRQHTIDHTS